MDLHETLAKLTRHHSFKEWHSANKKHFLAHAFVLLDDANKDAWQIGFYNPDDERMVTFVCTPTAVQHTEPQEVLKSEAIIEPLRPEDVTLSIEDAVKAAKKCFDDNYHAEKQIKHFFIIQTLSGKAVFNLTYLTQSFKTINMKIDAKSGTVIKHSVASLAEFG